jgi:hypothetical protein
VDKRILATACQLGSGGYPKCGSKNKQEHPYLAARVNKEHSFAAVRIKKP